ncbi:MAG: glycosyltransferase family 61 protein [Alphaproteobacteria bacterium]|nr:glycosyltransferase family 61 protein [Alphaproteobacteria bacterium]
MSRCLRALFERMLGRGIFSLFGSPSRINEFHAPPRHDAIIRRISELAEPDPEIGEHAQSYGLSAEDVQATIQHFRNMRLCLAFHALCLRAKEDAVFLQTLGGLAEQFFAFPGVEEGDFTQMRLLAERRVRGGEEAHVWADIRARDPEAAQILETRFGAAAFYHAFGAFLDTTFGFPELATDENFDERSYLFANRDVGDAVARGEIASARVHFSTHGREEGRQLRVRRDACRDAFVYPLSLARSQDSNFEIGDIVAVDQVSRSQLLKTEGAVATALVAPGEAHDARQTFRLEDSIGAGEPEFDALATQCAWRSAPVYLAAFRDACVELENGILLFERDKAWGDSFFATVLAPGGLNRAPDIFPLDGRYGRLRRAEAETMDVETPVMLACFWASRVNHGHWLMNSLFSVYLALDELRSERLKLLCPPLSARQREEFVRLGAPTTSIIEASSRYVRASKVIYPSPLTSGANMFPGATCPQFLTYVAERFAGDAQDRIAPKYVYISREGFASGRLMANERLLADALAGIGFAVIRPHELSFPEQIRAMSNAAIVIGQFGAALWNTGFAPRHAKIIEIATSNYVSNEYLFLSHLCGREFYRVMIAAESPQNRAYEGESFSFDAPVGEIVALARKLM